MIHKQLCGAVLAISVVFSLSVTAMGGEAIIRKEHRDIWEVIGVVPEESWLAEDAGQMLQTEAYFNSRPPMAVNKEDPWGPISITRKWLEDRYGPVAK